MSGDTSAEPRLNRYRALWHRWARFVAQRLMLKPVVRMEISVRVQGAANLDGLTGSFVLVTNHSSHLDAPLIVTALPYRVTKHLAVAAAADYFYKKWWIKALTSVFFNSYPVYRNVAGMGRGNSVSMRLLDDDVPIAIFPEGTRARDGHMKRFKPGAAALCVEREVPCVPIAIEGAHRAMPVGRFWPISGRPRVEVYVSRPLYPQPGETARAFNTRMEGRVSAMLTARTADVAELTSHRPTDDQSRGLTSAEGEAS